jgi:hypothetical protein
MTEARQGRDGTGGHGRALPAAATTVAVCIVALAALLFAGRPLGVAFPEADLDGSWMVVLGEALRLPARWGVDLAFTYGPASALVTRYFTDGYLAAALPAAVVLASVFGLCFGRLAAEAASAGPGPRRGASTALLAAALGEAAGLLTMAPQIPDAFYFVLPLNVFLFDLYRRRGGTGLVAVSAAAAGGLALSKSSYGALALALFVLTDLRSLLALRRAPVLSGAFGLGFLAAYLAFGQHLGDLPAYLRLQGEVAAGYGEAMYATGSRRELACFLVACLALVAAAALPGDRDRLRRLLVAGGLGLVLLLGFKAAFLRQDTHPQIGWSLLGLAGLSVAAGVALRRSVPAAAALGAAALAVLWVAAPLFLAVETGAPAGRAAVTAAARSAVAAAGDELGSWDALLRDPSGFAENLRAAKAAAFAAVRAAHPLPRLDGTVDILPSEQTSVLAAGLDYHPRPSFQDYSTYTAGLIAANLAFYEGPAAPEWVLFGVGGLDDRFPATMEGALWPVLLRRYEPVRRAGALLVLHRRAVPLPAVLGPAQAVPARLNQRFAVPEGATFARIAVRETALGRLAALLFRPPALKLRLTLAGGATQDYRFIPAIAAEGFLLSPTIDDAEGFMRLALGDAQDAGEAVTGAEVGGSALSRWFYAPGLDVSFQAVAVPSGPVDPEARALAESVAQGRSWRQLARRIGPPGALRGDRLSAAPPSALSLPVAGATHLRVGFGIEDGAWTQGRVAGVCFAVHDGASTGPELWRRCLDPRDSPADRGGQVADIDLPGGTTAVTLETACRGSCDWGWAYWDDARPAR